MLSSLRDFVIREGFWLHPRGVPGMHFRACEHTASWGLRRLHRQIPHTD